MNKQINRNINQPSPEYFMFFNTQTAAILERIKNILKSQGRTLMTNFLLFGKRKY